MPVHGDDGVPVPAPGDLGAPAIAPGDAAVPVPARGYHAPPPPPRDQMWQRIEASGALRPRLRPPSAAASAPVAPASARVRPASRSRTVAPRPRAAAAWVATLAAAASLVLGIAIGRAMRAPDPGEVAVPEVGAAGGDVVGGGGGGVGVAVAEGEGGAAEGVARSAEVAAAVAAAPGAPSAEVVTAAVAPGAPSAEVAAAAAAPGAPSAEVVAAAVEAVAAAPPTATPSAASAPPGAQAALDGPGTFATARRDRFEPGPDYVTVRHMGRAATLLTAFRTDRRTPESQQDLARWARELLVDTRMFLGLYDSRSPIEPDVQDLLEDLELVLIQIARLGPGAPEFEWLLARESMARRGTLARLRAASAEGEL